MAPPGAGRVTEIEDDSHLRDLGQAGFLLEIQG